MHMEHFVTSGLRPVNGDGIFNWSVLYLENWKEELNSSSSCIYPLCTTLPISEINTFKFCVTIHIVYRYLLYNGKLS